MNNFIARFLFYISATTVVGHQNKSYQLHWTVIDAYLYIMKSAFQQLNNWHLLYETRKNVFLSYIQCKLKFFFLQISSTYSKWRNTPVKIDRPSSVACPQNIKYGLGACYRACFVCSETKRCRIALWGSIKINSWISKEERCNYMSRNTNLLGRTPLPTFTPTYITSTWYYI